MKKYIVRLTDGERQTLDNLVSTGKAAAYKIKHANILLQVDADGPGCDRRRRVAAWLPPAYSLIHPPRFCARITTRAHCHRARKSV